MKKAAPVGPAGTFSEAAWEEIKQSLADIDVDLDTAKVSAHFGARSKGVYQYSGSKHGWLSVGPEWLLREALQRLAYPHTLPKPPTAKKRAGQLRDLRAAIEIARRQLRFAEEERLYNYPHIPSDVTRDRQLYDLMTGKIGELQEREAKLKVIGSSRKYNRLTALGEYCRELTGLWRACGDGKPHEESLRRFLLAASRAPFTRTPYAKMTTEELEEKIDSFLTNLSRS